MEVYWIWLSLRPGITKLRAAKLIKYFADPEAIFDAGEEELRQSGVTEEKLLAGLLDKDLTRAHQTLDICGRNGWGVVDIMHPAYPQKLKNITDAPLVLYLRGKLPAVDERVSIGVVGTRNAGPYGLRQTYRLSQTLTQAGAVIVSGGALGVDTQALKAAVDAGYPCIAVVAGGLDRLYPVENEGLFDCIAETGCVLTQYLPGTPCQKYQFLERNRIISGLSDGVLVTEAPLRSGAMSTARHAKKQGRDLYAMPGPITEPNFGGCHDLIRNHGAVLVDDGLQMVEPYRDKYPDMGSGEKNNIDKNIFCGYTVPHKETPVTKDPLIEILQVLMDQPMDVSELAYELGTTVAKLEVMLLQLELQGRVQRILGGRYRVIH